MRDVGGSENQHSNLLLGFMPMVYSIKPLSMLLYITLVLGTADGSSRADRVGRVVEVKAHGKPSSLRNPPLESKPFRIIDQAKATNDDEIQQCNVYLDSDREATFVYRRLTCPRYGILHDVVLAEQLNNHQSEGHHAEEQNKQKDQMNGSPSQHQKLDLGRIIGLAPWGAQMLRALKWKPEIKDLPFPYPSGMNIDEELEKDSYDCEAFQTLRLRSRTNHSKEVRWSIWVRLNAPVLEEGFRISRISTTISENIPGLSLDFSMSRLEELEANAERFLPNSTQYPSKPNREHLCSRQLNRYLYYILGKNNGEGSTALLNDKKWKPILWRIVMWLFAGQTDPKIEDHFIPIGAPIYRVTDRKSAYPPQFILWPSFTDPSWILY